MPATRRHDGRPQRPGTRSLTLTTSTWNICSAMVPCRRSYRRSEDRGRQIRAPQAVTAWPRRLTLAAPGSDRGARAGGKGRRLAVERTGAGGGRGERAFQVPIPRKRTRARAFGNLKDVIELRPPPNGRAGPGAHLRRRDSEGGCHDRVVTIDRVSLKHFSDLLS